MSEHSLDVLTDTHGRWVPVGGILRWRGEHLAPEIELPEPPTVVRGGHGTCGCGEPTYSPRADYCLECQREARRRSWRGGKRRRAERRALARQVVAERYEQSSWWPTPAPEYDDSELTCARRASAALDDFDRLNKGQESA